MKTFLNGNVFWLYPTIQTTPDDKKLNKLQAQVTDAFIDDETLEFRVSYDDYNYKVSLSKTGNHKFSGNFVCNDEEDLIELQVEVFKNDEGVFINGIWSEDIEYNFFGGLKYEN